MIARLPALGRFWALDRTADDRLPQESESSMLLFFDWWGGAAGRDLAGLAG